jgi:hypothetical protein
VRPESFLRLQRVWDLVLLLWRLCYSVRHGGRGEEGRRTWSKNLHDHLQPICYTRYLVKWMIISFLFRPITFCPAYTLPQELKERNMKLTIFFAGLNSLLLDDITSIHLFPGRLQLFLLLHFGHLLRFVGLDVDDFAWTRCDCQSSFGHCDIFRLDKGELRRALSVCRNQDAS